MNTHKIRCGEIYTSIDIPALTCTFSVTDKFFKVLKKKPLSFVKRGYSGGNAYVFGKLFKRGYKLIGQHGNDGAQTGLLDITKITKEEYKTITNDKPWIEIYLSKKKSRPWDDPKALKKVQELISSRILFVGYTFGGDTGANVYAHFDPDGSFNSIIIDNNYLFPSNVDFDEDNRVPQLNK